MMEQPQSWRKCSAWPTVARRLVPSRWGETGTRQGFCNFFAKTAPIFGNLGANPHFYKTITKTCLNLLTINNAQPFPSPRGGGGHYLPDGMRKEPAQQNEAFPSHTWKGFFVRQLGPRECRKVDYVLQ
jgi:hypothetical protein